MTPPKRLLARDLTKVFGRRTVVDRVTLHVEAGEVVGLLGPNGSGKTTTFHMIVGLLQPQTGAVYLDDTEITALPMHVRARRGITYLPQEASIFRKMTVEENIRAILETLDTSPAEQAERLDMLLEDLGVAHVRGAVATTLSGGERRRVEIARALVLKPAFLLLDEPFAGIDPIAVADLQGIIGALRDRGIGVLVTDHNVRETLGICDRAYLVSDGRVLESGIPRDIMISAQARRVYLGEQFRL